MAGDADRPSINCARGWADTSPMVCGSGRPRLRWKDETRLAQTQSADHVDGEKVRLEVAALMSAAVTSACMHANAKRPTSHSHSLVPVPSIFTLHVIIANMCCSKNTYK